MAKATRYSLVDVNHLALALRDAGYKSTSSAVAELVDNALEARATKVDIYITKDDVVSGYTVTVVDNGTGMTPATLRLALQFGGSTRFNSRYGMGRFGMGLPCSSLSQARRVEVYSWEDSSYVWRTYLDVDEIGPSGIAEPSSSKLTLPDTIKLYPRGTVVVWSKCDHLSPRRQSNLTESLVTNLGRIFRRPISKGCRITVNGLPIQANDPLFIHSQNGSLPAAQYGPDMEFDFRIPAAPSPDKTTTVTVRFSELRVEEWHRYSNDQKRRLGISKGAGVSVLRADREIDYGWYFMGSKHRENYDDWWRCEVNFSPELDELFGVTHTKQNITPTETLNSALGTEIERVARELNARVRRRFARLRSTAPTKAERDAQSRDHLLEPPKRAAARNSSRVSQNSALNKQRHQRHLISGFDYEIQIDTLGDEALFAPKLSRSRIVVLLNKDHPFFERIYMPLLRDQPADRNALKYGIELMLLALARAELSVKASTPSVPTATLRIAWSNTLATFLS